MTADATWQNRFATFAEKKTAEAAAADISPLDTVQAGRPWPGAVDLGNEWSRRLYDGGFALPPVPAAQPSVSLVFVQSRDGNTGASDPASLGGGDVDKHLIYEGLARVAAHAVMAGATTAASKSAFFSVWRPELVELRASLGLRRHPTQIVASRDGHLDVNNSLLFNVPDVPVVVLAGAGCREQCGAAFASRPWVSVVPIEGDHGGWPRTLARLRAEHGIERISAIGGRVTATSLIDAGVVQDICLTTTGATAGEPDTPFYTGLKPPTLELIVRKQSRATANPILFEHLAVESQKPPVL
ncbi:MAG TPA: dihydrofolate reductase family protein [Vicinamibacterales bacterium]|nr:dihydrofolate reductase family protein [Vicinamibacterales bacterium]